MGGGGSLDGTGSLDIPGLEDGPASVDAPGSEDGPASVDRPGSVVALTSTAQHCILTKQITDQICHFLQQNYLRQWNFT